MDRQALTAALSQFTGTEGYTRYSPKILLTDGMVFLAENAGCFWLIDVFASHLLTGINGEKEPFTCLNLIKAGESAEIVIDDGNGYRLASQEILYTDFPLDEIRLYGCWENDVWVLMLPNEY
jgi:hypothetical protein